MTLESLLGPKLLGELYEAAEAAPPGDFLEVGVYKGGSADVLSKIAIKQGRRLFLFDTFTGTPFQRADVDKHLIGDFNDTNLEDVRRGIPTAIFRPGIFPETLTDDVGPVAFAHVDCDQYQSVKDCCERLGPLMVSGGIMVFDDYDWLDGARIAVDECFGKRVTFSPENKARVIF